jgi:phosphomannomutase
VSLEVLELLKELRKKVAIGFVGGSDLVKITEQLSVTGNSSECGLPASPLPQTDNLRYGTRIPVIEDFDFAFAENGLTAYKLGKQLPSQSFIKFVGEERYKKAGQFHSPLRSRPGHPHKAV